VPTIHHELRLFIDRPSGADLSQIMPEACSQPAEVPVRMPHEIFGVNDYLDVIGVRVKLAREPSA